MYQGLDAGISGVSYGLGSTATNYRPSHQSPYRASTIETILSLPIIPGRSAGGILLGTAAAAIAGIADGRLRPSYFASPSLPEGFVIRHRSAELELWESGGVITRIIVRQGYTGRIEERIGIGSTLAELEENAGALEMQDDGTILLPDIPGISFMIDIPDICYDEDERGAAAIIAISIFSPHRWP